ncbi:MAG: exo-alpha-sialidase, partial [Candidatus Hydrogenedentes bacterium]|nr:exo-alpha-sialidase [Candidatus Hydrogenedentota bacterium]
GWLEGNVVEGPEGRLWNLLRFNAQDPDAPAGERWDTACLVGIEDNATRLSFDPRTGFLDFPGGHTKFTIRRDPASGLYLTLSNGNLDPARPTQRAVLSLYRSDNLRTWQHAAVLLDDDSGLSYEDSFRFTGFQYVDWHFDGDDIIYLVRTAYDGADTFHNANRITFHRIAGFRRLAAGACR